MATKWELAHSWLVPGIEKHWWKVWSECWDTYNTGGKRDKHQQDCWHQQIPRNHKTVTRHITRAEITFNAKHPVIQPGKHLFTKLVVQRAHTQLLHSRMEFTAVDIQQNYRILRSRQVVKSFLRVCVTCLRVAGKPYQIPVIPSLPGFRLDTSTPFTLCGVDFTGALFYKCGVSNGKKAFICLFTCAVTRYIHLELVMDLSSDKFLRALKRFAAGQPLPRHMLSDNGTTFVAGAIEL